MDGGASSGAVNGRRSIESNGGRGPLWERASFLSNKPSLLLSVVGRGKTRHEPRLDYLQVYPWYTREGWLTVWVQMIRELIGADARSDLVTAGRESR